jgi:aflatoxin B1 aldehyde reductase
MTTSNGIKIIYGAGSLSHAFVKVPPGFETFHDYAAGVLDALKKEKIDTLDTAEIYPGSEEEIAYHQGADKFIIDTKIRGGFGESRNGDEIIAAGKARLEALKTKQVSDPWQCSVLLGQC